MFWSWKIACQPVSTIKVSIYSRDALLEFGFGGVKCLDIDCPAILRSNCARPSAMFLLNGRLTGRLDGREALIVAYMSSCCEFSSDCEKSIKAEGVKGSLLGLNVELSTKTWLVSTLSDGLKFPAKGIYEF